MTNRNKVSGHQGGSPTYLSPSHAYATLLLKKLSKALPKKVVRFADMEKSMRFSRFADKDKLKVETKEGTYLAIGVGSVQADERHVLFLDLDGYDQKECESIAREVISKLGVSDCYIIQSSPGNHHLVTLDLVDFNVARRLARAYGHEAWAKFRGMNEDFVLRIGPKIEVKNGKFKPVEETLPKLVSVVKSPFNYHEKSNSLRRIFRNVWGYDIKKDRLFNNDIAFRMHIYKISIVGNTKKVEFHG